VTSLHEGREMGWSETRQHLSVIEDLGKPLFPFHIHWVQITGLEGACRPAERGMRLKRNNPINTATHRSPVETGSTFGRR
jgi:hypothetical protein